MAREQIHVRVRGRISDATADILGAEVAAVDDGFELIYPYVDHAQLTGLLVQLSDLHIAFDRIEVCGSRP